MKEERQLSQRPDGLNGYQEELAQRFRAQPLLLNMQAVSTGEQRRPYLLAEGVAIINVTGVLVHEAWWWDETEYGQIKAEVGQALNDAEVKKILLRVNSPGGETDGAFETAAFLAEAAKKKPMWSVADCMAYSAGYLLASQASKIYVQPVSGGVGSIGVYAMHVDYSGMLEQAGVDVTFIAAGEGKTDGNRFEPLSKAAKERIQTDVDRLYAEFVKYVSRARNLSEERVRKLGAWTYDGSKVSISAGLADLSGSVEDAWLALAIAVESTGFAAQSTFGRQAAGATAAAATDPLPRRDASGVEVPNLDADVIALCNLARRPELAKGFVDKKSSIADVREELLRLALADDGEEINNHPPNPNNKNGRDEMAGMNMGELLIAACEKTAAETLVAAKAGSNGKPPAGNESIGAYLIGACERLASQVEAAEKRAPRS